MTKLQLLFLLHKALSEVGLGRVGPCCRLRSGDLPSSLLLYIYYILYIYLYLYLFIYLFNIHVTVITNQLEKNRTIGKLYEIIVMEVLRT